MFPAQQISNSLFLSNFWFKMVCTSKLIFHYSLSLCQNNYRQSRGRYLRYQLIIFINDLWCLWHGCTFQNLSSSLQFPVTSVFVSRWVAFTKIYCNAFAAISSHWLSTVHSLSTYPFFGQLFLCFFFPNFSYPRQSTFVIIVTLTVCKFLYFSI